MIPTTDAENRTIHTIRTLKDAEDVSILTCSRIRLKPTIKKIVLTDKRFGTDIFKVEVSGLIDAEIRNIASGIMGLMTDKGYEPKLDVELETPHSNPDPPL